MKINKIVAVFAGALLISACHHTNPLKTNPRKQSTLFLMNASANAEKRLHFAIQNDSYGYGYLECMAGKISPEMNCQELYYGMVSFAREGHYAGFNSITLSDLTDPAVFETLADVYAETAVSSWPQFYPVTK
jgi:hypothetical protein